MFSYCRGCLICAKLSLCIWNAFSEEMKSEKSTEKKIFKNLQISLNDHFYFVY